MTVDITDAVHNYTVATYTNSNTNGQPSTLIACDASKSGFLAAFYVPDCIAQLNRQKAAGQTDFYDVTSSLPYAGVKIDQWQAINHTDWEINDNLLVKNIISYANLDTTNAIDLFGLNFIRPEGGQNVFATAGIRPGLPTTNQNSMVEELQLQGTSLDDALTWQGGLYYEHSDPHGNIGAQSPAQIVCDLSTLNTTNSNDFRCDSTFFLSNVQLSRQQVEYDNRAIYSQATYDINEQWSTTGGLRYTWDKTKGRTLDTIYKFDSDGVLEAPNQIEQFPLVKMTAESDKPTWVTDVSYKPTVGEMLYAKYSRGYRQGGVNPAGQHPIPGKNDTRIDIHGPEKVDTYEIGSKSEFAAFDGRFPGTFNAAAFYNDFRDQQLQEGILTSNGTGSTAILNAGKSRIWGMEIESNVALFENFQVGLSYTYLNTEVLKLEDVSALINSTGATASSLSTTEGEELPYSPKNQLVASARYLLPVPANYGNVTLGASYVYYDKQLAVSKTASPYYELPSYKLVGFNLDWEKIAGSPIDASLFVTNAFNEEYSIYRSGLWQAAGFETSMTGMPRMIGARARYNFGAAK
jgi:iron complex outermembrane receptor protein